jgi:elongator complex protein 2
MNGAVDLEFVSVGCNKVAHCVHWGRNNLVAFGANNFVAIYNPAVSIIHN